MRETALESAYSHLACAVTQLCASDDQIIADHVRAAYELIKVVIRADQKAKPARPEPEGR